MHLTVFMSSCRCNYLDQRKSKNDNVNLILRRDIGKEYEYESILNCRVAPSPNGHFNGPWQSQNSGSAVACLSFRPAS